MIIAVLNCGSSSIKFSLFDQKEERLLLKQMVSSLSEVVTIIQEHIDQGYKLIGIGHRVVHGGSYFQKPTLINADVLDKIEKCSTLAPLHNPTNLLGIFEMKTHFPDVPNVAVFDTAFHQTIPPYAHIYPIPYHYYEKHNIRRFGFHGISHEYLTIQGASKVGKEVKDSSFLIAHLGNGASVTAVEKGISVDTSMGFTPLEGLMMGTRSGSIDPSLVDVLAHIEETSSDEIISLLNQKSGLLGISGISNDMRYIHDDKSPRAKLSIDMFVDRLAKTIAGFRSSLRNFDGLIFAGGIGENDAAIREKTIKRLSFLGLTVDCSKNQEHGRSSDGLISEKADPGVWVIHTDEEKMIMKEVACLLSSC